ncbi:MAG: hypothetical protein IT443_12505 [Phycisphaeraceae bacterium]|nr:hypothetical protein [Phycisphaeraceae bacterium]
MSARGIVLTLIAAGSVFFMSTSMVAADSSEAQDLAATVSQLEARVAAQDAKIASQDKTIAEMSKDKPAAVAPSAVDRQQVEEIVRQVMADSATRPSLSGDHPIAGYDKGFFLGSADGNNLLKINGLFQGRYIYDHLRHNRTDDTGGFEVTRAELVFSGHALDPTWKYQLQTGYTSTGLAHLQNAFIEKTLGCGFSVTVGQFKVPFWQEYLVASGKQQLVERSLLSAAMPGYTQGVKVDYFNNMLHLIGAVGEGGRTVVRNSRWDSDATEIGAAARAELLLLGDWKQYGEFESWQGDKPMVVIGGATHYENAQNGTVNGDLMQFTLDGSAKLGGANLFVAGLASNDEGGADLDQFGLLTQGGYFVTKDVELVARYEWMASPDVPSELSIISTGVNYFFAKHMAKWGLDVGYAFNPVDDAWDSTATGWRTDSGGHAGQVVVRTQLQFSF